MAFTNIQQAVGKIENIELALTQFNAQRALSEVDKQLEKKKKVGDTTLDDIRDKHV
ncbi:hypothetical protein ACQKII_23965 [Lysinibacillus sp. NPDC048646]|uniref:hypothetical protein n=1 Tax=Lysinibacillus sp. NPDC048646 TaxID=3390574 RepID=UPI003D00B683